MIYSPERKHNSHTMLYDHESVITMICDELIIFSRLWPLILLHHVPNGFLPIYCYVSPISVGFQLTFFFQTGRAWPCIRSPCRPVPGSSGSRQLPIFCQVTKIVTNSYPISLIKMNIKRFFRTFP